MELISSVEAHYDDLSHPRKKKHVWKNVCNDLVSQNIDVTPALCSKKWQNLVRSYKGCKDIKNKSGRGPVRFQFFDALDNLLASKLDFTSSHNTSTTVNEQNDLDVPVMVEIGTDKETDECSDKQDTKTKYCFRKEFLQVREAQWEKRRQDKKEYNAEKLQLKKRKLDIEERKVKALEDLLAVAATHERCNININMSI
ncbi:hypothetical protein CBL_07399 [Carabus blaptoides fortunei]